MKIGIIGGSAAGLYSAIFIKKAYPDFSVTLIEKNDRLGKKLSTTGNGHCNLLNNNLSSYFYFDNHLVDNILDKYPYSYLEKSLNSLGITLFSNGNLVYPLSFHAPSYVAHLQKIACSLGVDIRLSTKVQGYEAGEKITIDFGDKKEDFDKLIIATGGSSQGNLGSDGSFYEELKRHGYKINELLPGLCPIKTKEKLKSLSGLRHRAGIRVFSSGRLVYGETGEILFKDDGLSGIAIMNASSYIAHLKDRNNVEIHVDLFPSFEELSFRNALLSAFEKEPIFFLDGVLQKPLKDYVLYYCKLNKKARLDIHDIMTLSRTLKHLTFHYEANYPFDSSQVTIGGLSIDEVDYHLLSKKEKNVYFVGEVLDVDGICGGYNLSFALMSALEVASNI